MYQSWTREWLGTSQAQASKYFYFSPNRHKARYAYKLARLELGRFVRIITGHNNLNYFQTRIGLWGCKTCRFCLQADETFVHLLTVCPPFRQAREDIFQDVLPNNEMKWSVRELLNFSYTPSIDLALIGTWAHGDHDEWNLVDSIVDSPSDQEDDSL